MSKKGTPEDPRFIAAAKLIGRTGARSFEIRFDEGDTKKQQTVWIAIGEWRIKNNRPVATGGERRFECAAGMNPLTAVLRLLDIIIDGGYCDHCKRPSGVTDHWQSPMPMSKDICWYVYDPELEEYRRSCEGT